MVIYMINKVNYDMNKKMVIHETCMVNQKKEHEGYGNGLGHDTQGKYGK